MRTYHSEQHYAERIGWLRAAVLGANDGILSTTSLVVGVAAADAARANVLIAGVAGVYCGCDVNGCGRVCLSQLTSRYRESRS